MGAAACNPNPYCLNCNPRDLSVSEGGNDDLLVAEDMPPIALDLSGDIRPPCTPTNNGIEKCDGLDNDCNDKIDDVKPEGVAGDPNNCGMCGKKCQYANAFGQCMAAMCSMGACQPGYWNLDGKPDNGCEYACFQTMDPKDICDGKDNDCNGTIDDTFDLAKDVNNCGDCGNVCTFPGANGSCAAPECKTDVDCPTGGACVKGMDVCIAKVSECKGDAECIGMGMACLDAKCVANPKCKVDADCKAAYCIFGNCVPKVGRCLITTCKDGFGDADRNPANGCEYKCPVNPPVQELCNGKDDDCNGLVDDGATDVGGACDQACPPLAGCVMNKSCTYKLSLCKGTCCGVCTQGMFICAGGQRVCQAGKGPQLEVCNNLDDNCDGQIDEGFDVMNDPKNCGTCANACSANDAVSGCSGGKCSILTCKPGAADLNKMAADGCEYKCPVNPPTVESCNGKDDDCDGAVDNAVTPPQNFCNQTGPCAGTKATCGGAKGWLCQYGMGVEVDAMGNLALSEKLCDGADGNCNGQSDESFVNKGKDCSAGSGACKISGKFNCSNDKASTVCSVMAGDPNKAIDELCNGVDDDCDGAVDERTDGPGNCFNGGQHMCKGWKDAVVKMANGKYIFAQEASRPDATANAVGTASSRACSVPGVVPWAPVNWDQARLACEAITDSAGKKMRLCDAAEWSAACAVGNAANPIWSYAANPTTYAAMTCNGFDRGLAKPWVTGSGAQCYANLPDGKVFDMSGNVGEWTSTPVVAGGKTYYKVRGGAYNNFGQGINCAFDFTIEQPGYQFNDLGFRCCSDALP